MRKTIFLAGFLIIIVSGSIAQFDPFIIRFNGIGSISLGSPYIEVESYCKQNGFRIEKEKGGSSIRARGLWVYSDDELLFYIGNKSSEEEPQIVKYITVFSRKFRTESEVSVGLSLNVFSKKYPGIEILESDESYKKNLWICYPENRDNPLIDQSLAGVFEVTFFTEDKIDQDIANLALYSDTISAKIIYISIYLWQ